MAFTILQRSTCAVCRIECFWKQEAQVGLLMAKRDSERRLSYNRRLDDKSD